MMESYFKLSGAMSEVLASYMVEALGMKKGDKIKEMIIENITFSGPMSPEKSRKCCNLIYAFDLYEDFAIKDLAYIASYAKI